MPTIGHGIISWDGYERRSRRYGSLYLDSKNVDENTSAEVSIDLDALAALKGQRVCITCTIVADRESGHAGDCALGISPVRPQRGDIIEVGVGILDLAPCPWSAGGMAIMLRPTDGRTELWIDPRALYKLHDQTVEVDIEQTDRPDSPVPDLTFAPPGAWSNGDGSIQVSGAAFQEGVVIQSEIQSLGNGLYHISQQQPGPRGHRLKVKATPPRR